jgi:hypothetical protein
MLRISDFVSSEKLRELVRDQIGPLASVSDLPTTATPWVAADENQSAIWLSSMTRSDAIAALSKLVLDPQRRSSY